MNLLKFYYQVNRKLENLRDIPLLIIRLILAYEFYKPAKMKWANIEGIASWFGSMNYPLPVLNAYLAATTEAFGVIFLIIRFGYQDNIHTSHHSDDHCHNYRSSGQWI
ncbi:hypothetical protein ES705_42228 [subsurface metagenome]